MRSPEVNREQYKQRALNVASAGFGSSAEPKRPRASSATQKQKKSWPRNRSKPAQLFLILRQHSTDSSDDDGGGDSNGVRWTSNMTAQSSSCSTDTVGSIHMGNTRSRMDNSRIGNLDNQIRFRLPQRQLKTERLNAV